MRVPHDRHDRHPRRSSGHHRHRTSRIRHYARGGNLGSACEILLVDRSSKTAEAGDIVSWLIRNWHVADPRKGTD
jgi:hypothetical protein